MLGDVLQPPMPPEFGLAVPVAVVDARNACALALGAYLERAVFNVWPGETGGIVRSFQLKEVLEEWPRPGDPLPYPCASVVDVTDVAYEAHNLVPTPLESTLNEHADGTVLWKLAELAHLFQVDFWLNTKPDREAVAARLPGLFAPGESRSSVLLEGPAAYYCRGVRVTLVSSRRTDDATAVYADERRLMTRMRCDIDVVELRRAHILQTITTADVVDKEAVGE